MTAPGVTPGLEQPGDEQRFIVAYRSGLGLEADVSGVLFGQRGLVRTQPALAVRGARDLDEVSPKRIAHVVREELMAAARRVFERDGYSGARVADITTEARVAHGSFYTTYLSNTLVLWIPARSSVT